MAAGDGFGRTVLGLAILGLFGVVGVAVGGSALLATAPDLAIGGGMAWIERRTIWEAVLGMFGLGVAGKAKGGRRGD